MSEPTADNQLDQTIRPDPVVMAAIKRLGLVGYLQEQLELWRGTWYEWECGEDDEELRGEWDGDMEQAAFFAALLEGARGEPTAEEIAAPAPAESDAP